MYMGEAWTTTRHKMEPPHFDAARLKMSERQWKRLRGDAPYSDRLAMAVECVRQHARERGEEVDWYRTQQYDGHDTYHAAALSLSVFAHADLLRGQLHRYGFTTWWEMYDPSPHIVRSWTRANTQLGAGVPDRAKPWGCVGIADAAPRYHVDWSARRGSAGGYRNE